MSALFTKLTLFVQKTFSLWVGITFIILISGLFMPFLRVDRLFIFEDEFSITESIISLFKNGDYLIAIIIFLFSILFPAFKLFTAFWINLKIKKSPAAKNIQLIHILEMASKWSMLDVFVAALVVFSVKASHVANAALMPGFYFFLTAILFSMFLSHVLKQKVKA